MAATAAVVSAAAVAAAAAAAVGVVGIAAVGSRARCCGCASCRRTVCTPVAAVPVGCAVKTGRRGGAAKGCAAHLVHAVGAHSQRILEGQMCGEGREPLPQGAHALLRDNCVATMQDAAVLPHCAQAHADAALRRWRGSCSAKQDTAHGWAAWRTCVELQPCLNDVYRLQAARLHHAAHGTGEALDDRMDLIHLLWGRRHGLWFLAAAHVIEGNCPTKRKGLCTPGRARSRAPGMSRLACCYKDCSAISSPADCSRWSATSRRCGCRQLCARGGRGSACRLEGAANGYGWMHAQQAIWL